MATSTNKRARQVVKKARVLIADDSEPVMTQIECLLSDDFDVVGKATNGIELLREMVRLQPDLIVTDLEMPGLSGIEASRAALKECSGLPILLLTSHSDPQLVQEAMGVGIRGYVLKVAAADELIPAAQVALRGGTFISESLR
jgi:two-component system response regulator DesR